MAILWTHDIFVFPCFLPPRISSSLLRHSCLLRAFASHNAMQPASRASSLCTSLGNSHRNMSDNRWVSERWRATDAQVEPDDATNNEEQSRSCGIEPQSFYKKKRARESRTPSEKQLHNILLQASENEVMNKRQEFASVLKVQRDAYEDVTSFRIFPLQDLAMDFLDGMTKEYLGGNVSTRTQQSSYQPKQTGPEDTEQDNEDDAEHSSKRQKMHQCTDTLRHQYTAEFMKEKGYVPTETTESNHQFLPALWSMEPRIFALETSSTGKRKYIVGNLGRFFHHYWRKSNPQCRHYYELIREGTPCRLYFDLEYSKEANPHISIVESEVLMTEFIAELCIQFRTIYGIAITRSCIIDLDSSTAKKFSRHLIVHLPNETLFADTRSAGAFVKQFVGRLADELATRVLIERRPILAKCLFVNSLDAKQRQKSGEEIEVAEQRNTTSCKTTCFVDLGVYTRNRLFRLMGSSKFGKPSSAALRISKANEFNRFPAGFDNSKFYVPDQTSTISEQTSNPHLPLNVAVSAH